jgi:aconitate hydratase
MDSFGARSTFNFQGKEYTVFRPTALIDKGYDIARLPYSLRILLENLLRNEDGLGVGKEDIEALANWKPKALPNDEISFTPARVILQDFTGVPCVVDLAAMRDAMTNLSGDPRKINPLQPVELVIDHSVQTDAFGRDDAILVNRELEFERNKERYEFLKWGQDAFDNFKVVPPNTGIVHQVNLEYLARVAFEREMPDGTTQVYPDTLVGTDSHTTMVNGLGVLGWGVGGIEAEAAMLGQPVSMLIPQVIGFKLINSLPEGTTATDLVLTVTEMLRKKGVVGKFVEFFGPGMRTLKLADRATIGNMSPEFGATCAIFPVDEETLRYMRLTGRSEQHVALTEAYFKESGLFYSEGCSECSYSDTLELDLSTVQPSVAGPKRPQDRLRLGEVSGNFVKSFEAMLEGGCTRRNYQPRRDKTGEMASAVPMGVPMPGDAGVAVLVNPSNVGVENAMIHHGDVVVAAITSCTNTSNPAVMVAAGLVAKKAVERGLMTKPWVKTSLAPGSRVITDVYDRAGLTEYMKKLRFHVVGYGCMTCIGNSGPLPDVFSHQVNERKLVVCSVLSGNRNFEGRINQDVRANYLMSPPLVVAYALAGTVDIDIANDPLGHDLDGQPVYLKDVWPTQDEVETVLRNSVHADLFEKNYKSVFTGDEKWESLLATESDNYNWDAESTYVKNPPYFDGMSAAAPTSVPELTGMRALALLGDSITTDHISPAGAIKLNSPAGLYLTERGVTPPMFNSYGSRRGNHEVMVRGTFANIRLRNQLAPGTEGGFTTYLPTGEVTTIYQAAMQYKTSGTPLVVIAGKEYGSGSSRDWAAKGTYMLGIKLVLAESFERIHRSNLIGMGVVPAEFTGGQNAASLGLTGEETFTLDGLSAAVTSNWVDGKILNMKATSPTGKETAFKVLVRIDTPQENLYYLHGGILQYVLRQLISA